MSHTTLQRYQQTHPLNLQDPNNTQGLNLTRERMCVVLAADQQRHMEAQQKFVRPPAAGTGMQNFQLQLYACKTWSA
jgi:hypothetical protein